MSLPRYVSEIGESSYSGSTVYSAESDVEDITHSDFESEYIPSETSEDRDFVVSDSESLSCVSIETSAPESSGYNILHDGVGVVGTCEIGFDIIIEEQGDKSIKPLRTIAKRIVNRNGRQTVQYLVLWYSWETAEPVPQ
ncbi:uncharacterized protein N7446_003964 [Penicillium canescens]|uniref:Uncharacterized protein n=1 Tax=Penicillium canescens TaxID=5083 RepID=A0AAD6I279_PENCN|nr:uncharacterized protein N7446_003964 [Penicillium canescens]KAJ6027443.1 hypothetical protein N7460_012260 [Penicillium canescens]KAJ6040720.1 hypothetical protein N7444_009625 [Penicillium canescens]KAJ6066927.1 hypothetical protein N7446_003964 [Penicillium canescens]